MESGAVVLIAITCFAAFVNGALGYGFSSLTVPVALLFYANRILNPALVLIEVFVNLYVLLINRKSIPLVWKRLHPIVLSLLPGVAAGSHLVATIDPGWMKFATYATLLPLILIQVAGLRRPIRSERRIGVLFGTGLGFLYSVTTISGPPLAVLLNNQGLAKRDFRAGLALIRVAESTLTAIAYYQFGLFNTESFSLIRMIVPGLLIAIPLGAQLIRRVDAEMFRRICMSFDVWIVSFGLARVLTDLKLAQGVIAFSPMIACGLLDIYLLYRFFRKRPAATPIRTVAAFVASASPAGPQTRPAAKRQAANRG